MSAVMPTTDIVTDAHALGAASGRSLTRRILHNPIGIGSIALLVAIIAAGVLAPVLAPRDPNLAAANDVLAQPGGKFLLGADGSGRDILSRLLYAIRPTLEGALIAVVVAAIIGITAGLISGYYGRWFETVSSAFFSMLMALPAIVALLAARAVLGPSLRTAMFIFGILLSPAFYRVVSAAVSGVRSELYVDAARVCGLSDARIMARHILTLVRAPAIVLAASLAGIAIAIETGLDFLGLGDLSVPTWGGMLNDAYANIYSRPIELLWPSLAIGLTLIGLMLFGNALRDELERAGSPSRRRRKRTRAHESVDGLPQDAHHETVIVHREANASSSDVVLDIDGLAVGYDQPDGSIKSVVENVSLSICRGAIHGLVGESGSGKTQTAFSVLRLLSAGGRITSGTIAFNGIDLASVADREMVALRGSQIAYIPQEPMSNLDPSFTLGSQLTEPMRVKLDIGRREARERALHLLHRVGILDPKRTFDAYPHQVSGGMAQRVLIAGAVSCSPQLLIADEPTTALDVTVQAEVLDLLRDLQAELKMSVILVTHNFGVVADLCDEVSIMKEGRIVESGPTRSIFEHPRHAYTKALFDANLADSAPREPLVTVDSNV